MAKREEKRLARIMFVEQGKTRREIAHLVNVREKTVGDWVRDGNWDDLRAAYVGRDENVIGTLKQLVHSLAEQRLQMDKSGAAAKDKRGVMDELSKATKALSTALGEKEVSLSARIKVMEWVFEEIKAFDSGIFFKLVELQEQLLEKATRLHE